MARLRLSLTAIPLFFAAGAFLLPPFAFPAGTSKIKIDPKRGRGFYVERCVFCHGQEGRGWDLHNKVSPPPVPVPDISDPEFMSRFTNRDLFKVIQKGGTRMGKSRFMPPAGRWLSDDDIRDVIAYIRALERKPQSGNK